MTVASYTSDLADIFMFETTTDVSAYGGGGAGLGASTDFAMEGVNAVDKQITAAEKGLLYDSGSSFTIGADDHFFIWIMGATPGLNDTRDNRGIVVGIGDGTAAFVKFHVDGSDTLPLGGGKVYPIRFVNTTLANFRTLVGTPGTTPQWIGGGLNTTGSVMGSNLGVDGARIGTGYDILGGTGADPEADFAGIAADDESTSEGVFQTAPGGYALQGKLRIGSAATACEFLASNALIVIKDTRHSLTDFTEILIENSASILTLSRVTFLALGTNNPGRFEMLTSAATVLLTDCVFQDFGVTVLGTGATFLRCAWIGSDIVTANGADLTGSSISAFEGTADTSPLIWDVATDPDGLLDDMSLTKGTAATHALEFGLNSPLTMTMRGMTSTGYNAANGNSDSTFHVKRTSGTVTINVVGGTGNFSYKTDGATVIIVINPVALNVTCEADGSPVQNARVLALAASGGDLPADVALTSLAQSGGTATATHPAAHNLVTGNEVRIKDALPDGYNGVHVITVTGATTYTYAVDSGLSSPATGTILASAVIIGGDLTTGAGLATDSRTYTADQPIAGTAWKGTSSPVYKATPFSETINKDTGLNVTVPMTADE